MVNCHIVWAPDGIYMVLAPGPTSKNSPYLLMVTLRVGFSDPPLLRH
jgi:hypothetical protein